MASFTTLVFATTGDMGKEVTVLYHPLTDLLSHKNNKMYSTTLAWMRCASGFSLPDRGSKFGIHMVTSVLISC